MSWRIECKYSETDGWEYEIEYPTKAEALAELANYRANTAYPCRLRYVRDIIPVLIEGVEIPIAREALSEGVLDKLDAAYDAELGVEDWEAYDAEADG